MIVEYVLNISNVFLVSRSQRPNVELNCSNNFSIHFVKRYPHHKMFKYLEVKKNGFHFTDWITFHEIYNFVK